MLTASVPIVLLAGVASMAVALAAVTAWRARRAVERMRLDGIELARTMTSDRRLADDLAHALDDLVSAITGHAAVLIASLDPSGPSMREAREIRRAAVDAERLTRQLCEVGGGRLAAPTAPATKPAPGTPPAARVLVVEDEPGMREFISLVLMRAGHQVLAVAGPRAALDALRGQQAIALMLVDVVMPEMDGYQVVAEARKVLPGIRVVFVSAFAPDPTRIGGDGFLAKPFTSESLTGIVEKSLSP